MKNAFDKRLQVASSALYRPSYLSVAGSACSERSSS